MVEAVEAPFRARASSYSVQRNGNLARARVLFTILFMCFPGHDPLSHFTFHSLSSRNDCDFIVPLPFNSHFDGMRYKHYLHFVGLLPHFLILSGQIFA